MSEEIKLQHWEKEIELKGMKFRIKKLTPFDFPAFKTVFAKSTSDGDPEGIAKSYEMMTGWVETEIMGKWTKVYDKASKQFIVDLLNDPIVANELIDLVLTDLIMPLFMNTAE